MNIRELVDFFSTFSILPVEISDVRDHLVEHGIQDDIRFVGVPLDPAKLYGMYVRFTRVPAPYAYPTTCSIIIYNSNLPIEWQRLVCCKELIHILDSRTTQTKTKDDLVKLIFRLTSPGDPREASEPELQYIKDEIAIYQALAILVPHEIRDDYAKLYKEGKITDANIADDFCIPEQYAAFVMSESWSKNRHFFTNFD